MYRDNVTSDVSPLTLDTIIDQTYSDPALEGLISEVVEGPSHVVNPARDHVSSAKDHVSSVRDHVIDGGNPSSDNQVFSVNIFSHFIITDCLSIGCTTCQKI